MDDIDGWDLNHAVKVKWKVLPIEPYLKNELSRPTLTRLENKISNKYC